MYEEVINYIRDKDNFSSTIFYDILAGEFMLDCHALKKVEKVMQKQGVNSIYDIDYSVLNLPDTLAVLYTTYLQDNNLVCPSKMFSNVKLELIADRPCRTGCSAKEWILILSRSIPKIMPSTPAKKTKQLLNE